MARKREKPYQHRGMVWPIILILVGVVYLLNNLGLIDAPTWQSIWQLWPVIFLAIGLDSLIRRKEIAGPVFMFGLGTVFLLNNLGWLTWDAWNTLWRLWPLMIIAIGLEIMFGRRWLWLSALSVLFIVAALLGMFWVVGVGLSPLSGQPVAHEAIYQALDDDARQADIAIAPSVGDLRIEESGDKTALISGEVSIGHWQEAWIDYRLTDSLAQYSLRSRNLAPFPGNAWRWQLGLTRAIPLALDVAMGAGDMQLDLADLSLADLEVSQGVGDLTIILPDEAAYRGDISQAVGQLVIVVPKDAAVRLEISRAISALSLPAGFEKLNDDYYSPGFDAAELQIDLDVSQAIGNIIVEYQK